MVNGVKPDFYCTRLNVKFPTFHTHAALMARHSNHNANVILFILRQEAVVSQSKQAHSNRLQG
jgi:hypothetical protein